MKRWISLEASTRAKEMLCFDNSYSRIYGEDLASTTNWADTYLLSTELGVSCSFSNLEICTKGLNTEILKGHTNRKSLILISQICL